MTYLLLSEKKWHDDLFDNLKQREGEYWFRIDSKSVFNLEYIDSLKPEKIFIPHWSYIILEEIFGKYECIVFHMTDLPYGRGGSPLQNLIARGHKETKISAIRINEGIDTGNIYLKRPLSLLGTAEEIFIRASVVIKQMIEQIIDESTQPVEQQGKPTIFKRRKPSDSNIGQIDNIDSFYDYVRMLDCEGYPPAFLETDFFRLEFSRASLKADKTVIADVRIIKK